MRSFCHFAFIFIGSFSLSRNSFALASSLRVILLCVIFNCIIFFGSFFLFFDAILLVVSCCFSLFLCSLCLVSCAQCGLVRVCLCCLSSLLLWYCCCLCALIVCACWRLPDVGFCMLSLDSCLCLRTPCVVISLSPCLCCVFWFCYHVWSLWRCVLWDFCASCFN